MRSAPFMLTRSVSTDAASPPSAASAGAETHTAAAMQKRVRGNFIMGRILISLWDIVPDERLLCAACLCLATHGSEISYERVGQLLYNSARFGDPLTARRCRSLFRTCLWPGRRRRVPQRDTGASKRKSL